jgi:hypothetical protein
MSLFDDDSGVFSNLITQNYSVLMDEEYSFFHVLFTHSYLLLTPHLFVYLSD